MRIGPILWVIIGLIAGWDAGKIMKGSGYGVVMDILLDVVGALVGGFLLGILGIHAEGLIGSIVVAIFGAAIIGAAIIGAVLLIWLSHKLNKA